MREKSEMKEKKKREKWEKEMINNYEKRKEIKD